MLLFTIIDVYPRFFFKELIYATFRGIELTVAVSEAELVAELKMQRIQMDDQLKDARFPVLLYPDIDFIVRNLSEHHEPFFYALILRQNHTGNIFDYKLHYNMQNFSYSNVDDDLLNISHFEMYIREFDIQLDEDFLLQALEFFRTLIPMEDPQGS